MKEDKFTISAKKDIVKQLRYILDNKIEPHNIIVSDDFDIELNIQGGKYKSTISTSFMKEIIKLENWLLLSSLPSLGQVP